MLLLLMMMMIIMMVYFVLLTMITVLILRQIELLAFDVLLQRVITVARRMGSTQKISSRKKTWKNIENVAAERSTRTRTGAGLIERGRSPKYVRVILKRLSERAR